MQIMKMSLIFPDSQKNNLFEFLKIEPPNMVIQSLKITLSHSKYPLPPSIIGLNIIKLGTSCAALTCFEVKWASTLIRFKLLSFAGFINISDVS